MVSTRNAATAKKIPKVMLDVSDADAPDAPVRTALWGAGVGSIELDEDG